MREPISGHPWQFVAVRANPWQSEAISVLAGDDVLRPEWPACMEHFELLMPNVLSAEREWLLHRDERHLMRDVIRGHQGNAPPDEGRNLRLDLDETAPDEGRNRNAIGKQSESNRNAISGSISTRRHHLHQVVLHHVPQDAVLVEVARTPLAPDLLLKDHLDALDVLSVPDGAKAHLMREVMSGH